MFRAASHAGRFGARNLMKSTLKPRPVYAAWSSASIVNIPQRSYASSSASSFLTSTNAAVIEDMHRSWKNDPESVESDWAEFFSSVENGTAPNEAVRMPKRTSKFAGVSSGGSGENVEENYKVYQLIRAYRVLGHFLAKLDPLNLEQPSFTKVKEEYKRELHPSNYGFTAADMDREFYVGHDFPGGKSVRTLRETIDLLQSVYCGEIGVQYKHVHDPSIKQWVKEKVESGKAWTLTNDEKKKAFLQVAEAEGFEQYCGKKFNAKRFGLDGGESLIPAMHKLVETAAEHGVENIVIGMPHRGRLNVMANIMGKPLEQLFSEFQMDSDKALSDSVLGSGDVKYHLGTSHNVQVGDKTIHLSLAANPSHLEAVNPVVLGKTRAKQTDFGGNVDYNRAMGVLIHGDAAFAGQGVVGEVIELSGLEDFSTGGTIHIIVNNQIGFTTVPKFARTSPYPSEIAKAAGSPIFHVNGDNPAAVAAVLKLAVEFRQKFHTDTVIDMYCYRRNGHNEFDQPHFTQPKMYQKIDKHPTVCTVYGDKLVEEKIIDEKERKKVIKDVKKKLDEGFKNSKDYHTATGDWLECHWSDFVGTESKPKIYDTGVEKDTLKHIMSKLVEFPEGFHVHKSLMNIRFAEFKKMIETEKNFNWAMGEALAFGSLLLEKNEVRLCGQDCERGTFNHRHAVLYCQDTEKTYENLKHLSNDQGFFNVINSSLSENAVLGFEHGYSLEDPKALVIWEAQFGDFANGAQVIFDQFITTGEQKWLRMSGLTMFLPHGYDGQGPEHSSGRVERFLQACDDDPSKFESNVDLANRTINIQVANCTTPANHFHLIRRQIHRNYRKPLVVMTPKSLLGHKDCVSDISEFTPESKFHRVYFDQSENMVSDNEVRRLVFCSGQVYYTLAAERKRLREENNGNDDVALVRIEQIAPFPYDLVKENIEKYSNAELVWVQEEPLNAGPWTYVQPRLETASGGKTRPRYIGRPPAAAPATGVKLRHNEELKNLVSKTFEK